MRYSGHCLCIYWYGVYIQMLESVAKYMCLC